MTTSATLSDPFAKRLQTIQHLISSGKLSEAADRLNGALKSSPRDPRVYLLGSRLAEAAGNAKGARDTMRKAVEFGPDWAPGVTEMAFLLARQNQFQEAIEFAQRAMRLDGDNPEVLSRVIDVAHRAQNFELGLAWLRRAAKVDPSSRLIKRMIARDLRLTGDHAGALAAYGELIAADPADTEARLGRLQAALAAGNQAQAAQDGEALVAILPNDEEAAFWRDVSKGATPPRQPASMARAMYDGFADIYDQHLVAGLKYQLPRTVARLIGQRYPSLALNVLDLGSGTGLLGAALGRINGAMVGVEISPRMIDMAARHNVYDKFHNVDLLEALEATPEGLYDVIAALDVFIYAGDMSRAIPDALRILKPGGHFIFSCEKAGEEEANLVLRPSQRYAHKASHIESLCKAAGFSEVSLQDMPLRFENNQPVAGFLVIAKKPA